MLDFLQTSEFILGLEIALVLMVAILAWSIYKNTRAVRSCNRQACLAFASDVYGGIAADPALAKLFRRGLNDFKTLPADEKIRMHYFLQSTVGLFRDSFNAYQENVISHDEYETNRAAAMAVLRMPGGKTWWQDAQNAYPQELRIELNAKGDLSYALGDIYPYFLLAEDEQANEDVDAGAVWQDGRLANTEPSMDNMDNGKSVGKDLAAANEDSSLESSTAATDWRRGLARRRARQNFVIR